MTTGYKIYITHISEHGEPYSRAEIVGGEHVYNDLPEALKTAETLQTGFCGDDWIISIAPISTDDTQETS